MADLWIFGRRPAALVRHRHGGFNATFPMNHDTVIEQAHFLEVQQAARERAKQFELQRPMRIEGLEAQNVVRFQLRGNRPERNAERNPHSSGRSSGRPEPFRD